MSRDRVNPPLSLTGYKDTILRSKIHYACKLLEWALAWLREVQDMDLDSAFDGLAHAKKLRRYAAIVEDVFQEAAIAELSHQGLTGYDGDGYTAALKSGGTRKGWHSSELMNELVERETLNQASRHPDIPRRAVRAIVTEAMWSVHKAGRVEWRATSLRARGISPDDFSSTTPGRATIDLRGNASYASSQTRRKIA